MSVGQLSVFLKTTRRLCLNFYLKLESPKGQKRKEQNFQKNPSFGEKAQNFLQHRVSIPSCFLSTQKWDIFVLLWKAHVWEKSCSEMLSANQIAIFLDIKYLWKESSDILNFFSWSQSPSKGSIWKSSSSVGCC